jgi:CubicO group peptidase (beta-lactamase class C family)
MRRPYWGAHDPVRSNMHREITMINPPMKQSSLHASSISNTTRYRTILGVVLSLWSLMAGLLQADGSIVDDVVAAEMKNHGIIGVSIAIIENGEICNAKGYGFTDEKKTIHVGSNTLFQAGSISKPVAALGALHLVEREILSLDADVNQFLKRWKVPENTFTKDEKVTLRRILSHSAGLTVHGFPGYDAKSRLPTLLQVLDGSRPANTAAIRVDVIPGSIWRYSGGGYTAMQQIMMDVSANSFPELMQETVLTPLQMTASSYEQPMPEDRAIIAATGYYANGEEVENKWHVYPEMAAAGLWTTSSDLARFAISLQNALAGKSNPVISESMTRQMLTVQKGNNGLGLALDGSGKTLRFFHGGRDAGFDAFLIAYAESGHGVVIMFNANNNTGAVNRIVDAIAKEYNWPSAN